MPYPNLTTIEVERISAKTKQRPLQVRPILAGINFYPSFMIDRNYIIEYQIKIGAKFKVEKRKFNDITKAVEFWNERNIG